MEAVDWQRKCIKNKQTRFLYFFFLFEFMHFASWNLSLVWVSFFCCHPTIGFIFGSSKPVVSQEAKACKSSPSFPSFCVGHCFWRWSATTDQKSSKWPLATPPPSMSKMALGSTLLAGFKTDFSVARIHCLWREGLSTYPAARRPLSIQSCPFCLIYPIGTKVAFAENW